MATTGFFSSIQISSARLALVLALAGAATLLPAQEGPQALAAAQTQAPQPAQESLSKRVRQHVANAEHPKQPHPAGIDRNGVIILVKSALMALDQANKTGNYTVLRDLGSPGFQVNTAARLAEIFASNRAQQLDFSGILVLEPQLTLLPQVEPSGMLHMAGFFPSAPRQLNFEMMWQPVNRQWRLFGLSVNLIDSSPTAPDTVPAPKPADDGAPPPQAPTGAIYTPSPKQ